MPVIADLELVRPGLEEFLPEIDFLIAAASFPEAATGTADLDAALRALEERCAGALVIVTRGARGAIARIEGRLVEFPGYRVAAVDTTGAGDVFHGAFAVAALDGRILPEAIDFANAVAAMKCRAAGGRTGIPRSIAEVERFRAAAGRRPPEGR
jgi:sugar/nucleoside kinase (ribokinase family)